MELERETEQRSLERDLDLSRVPLSACFNELPRCSVMDSLPVGDIGAVLEGVGDLGERISLLSYDVFGVVAAVEAESEALLIVDASDVFSVLARSSRDVDLEDGVGVRLPELELSFASFASFIVSVRFFMVLKISIGKSATPIVRLATVPNNADAPPEMGSQGPSSVSYSRGR